MDKLVLENTEGRSANNEHVTKVLLQGTVGKMSYCYTAKCSNSAHFQYDVIIKTDRGSTVFDSKVSLLAIRFTGFNLERCLHVP